MSIAFIAACLVPCFISFANPWFYTTTCGENGCPACHKVAHRGRSDFEASAGHARQAASELPDRARDTFGHSLDHLPASDKRRRWRGCAWEREDQPSSGAEMRERGNESGAPGNFLGTAGVASHLGPYGGTAPMRVPVVPSGDNDVGQPAVSFGVDVSHLAPKSEPKEADHAEASEQPTGVILSENPQETGPTYAPTETEHTNVSETTSQQQLPVRPMLDEAISWERFSGGQGQVKRKWWYMP